MAFVQGYYKPLHPEKYLGDVTKIRYMSSWELDFNKFLDNNPKIIGWASEEIQIPYIKPTDGQIHHYYPDYFIKYIDKNNNVIQEIIEIKPEKQTKPPSKKGKKSKATILTEQITYAVNISKWQYATAWCKQRNIKFRVLTESQLYR
jgi:hypothetical protein